MCFQNSAITYLGKKKQTNSQGGIVVDIDNDLDYLNWSSGTNLAENNIILKE